MENKEYWRERMAAMEEEQYQKSAEYIADVQKQYRRAISDIETDIAVWCQRIADNNGISYAAAQKMLKDNELEEFKWTVEAYIKAGEENAVDQRWMQQLENASAKYHISRLEAIKLQIQQRAEMVSAQLHVGLSEFLGEAYQSQYYHTAFELMRGVGIGYDLARINERSLDVILNRPWAMDGKAFSERIWDNKEKLVQNLHTELAQGLIRGTAPRKMASNLAKCMEVSRAQAERLILTETAAISARAKQDSYRELDVEEFQVLETLDSRTCEFCRDMDGRHFPMKDYEIGITVPPFHPRCRGTTIPYFDDEFTEDEMRAARDENDEGYELVPADMTYREWEEAFVKGGEKTTTASGSVPIEKKAGSGIIKSGARITDPESKEGQAFAKLFYPEIRKRTTDCAKIAANLGIKESEIQKIKDYLFMNNSLYDEDLQIWRQFDEDCAIAQSWQRLTDGKNIQKHDRTLIEHELFEMELKQNNPNMTHDEAHSIAQKRFNYRKEADEYYGNLSKRKKK